MLFLIVFAVVSILAFNPVDNVFAEGTDEASCSISANPGLNKVTDVAPGQYVETIDSTILSMSCSENIDYSIYATGYSGGKYGDNTLQAYIDEKRDPDKDVESGTATTGNKSNWAMRVISDGLTIESDGDGSFTLPHIIPTGNQKIATYEASMEQEVSTLEASYSLYAALSQASGSFNATIAYTLIPGISDVIDSEYTIEYNANGGIGSMEPQIALIDKTTNLEAVQFTRAGHQFTKWNTKADGTGDSYNDEAEVKNLTASGETVTLYAQWIEKETVDISLNYGQSIIFDGSSYIDTDLQLFSTENINKDFAFSLKVDSITPLSSQDSRMNTIFSNMDESGRPWPGFVFRYEGTNYGLAYNTATYLNKTDYFSQDQVSTVNVMRENNVLYFGLGDNPLENIVDFTGTPTFDSPLTIGATLNGSGTPFRYFKGKLSNIVYTTRYASSPATITLPEPTRTGYIFRGWYSDETLKVKVGNAGDVYTTDRDRTLYAKWADTKEVVEEYTHTGKVTFDGTNYLNTDMYLFDGQNIGRNFLMEYTVESIANDNSSQAVIMNSMDESNNKYPGIVMRIKEANTVKTEFLGNGSIQKKNNNPTPTTSAMEVKVYRIGGVVYASVNDSSLASFGEFNPDTDWFNVPVTFGAGLDATGSPFRFFKGSISDIHIQYLPDDFTLDDLAAPTKATETAYSYSGDMVFDGTNYVDTGIKLFSEANYQKDFAINFEIKNWNTSSEKQAVLSGAMDESGEPYAGIVFRRQGTANQFEIVINSSRNNKISKNYNASTTKKLSIMRKSGIIYVKVNNEGEEKVLDMTGFSAYFNNPVTFGAGLDASGNPFRFFQGTLSNLEILVEPGTEVPSPEENTDTSSSENNTDPASSENGSEQAVGEEGQNGSEASEQGSTEASEQSAGQNEGNEGSQST